MNKAYISELAYPEMKAWLQRNGYELCELPNGKEPYPAVSGHPDMYMTKANGSLIMAEEGTIRGPFPAYLGFNCVILDRYLIHNLRFTSLAVLRVAEKLGLTGIHVNQGYTKCSCVVVDGSSVITSDEGIYSVLQGYGDIDVLKVTPGYVRLTGFDYGFLGGASGRAGNTVLFNGDIDSHPDSPSIRRFISERGLEIFDVKGKELFDIGTIFT